MALAVIQSVLSTVAVNYLFDANWPLWGPALLLAASLVVAQALA